MVRVVMVLFLCQGVFRSSILSLAMVQNTKATFSISVSYLGMGTVDFPVGFLFEFVGIFLQSKSR